MFFRLYQYLEKFIFTLFEISTYYTLSFDHVQILMILTLMMLILMKMILNYYSCQIYDLD